MQAGSVSRGASDLGPTAARTHAALGAGGTGADESALHLADRCPAAARGPARRERERRELCQARCKARAARAIEVGDRAAAGGVCVGRSAARLDRCAPRASRAERRDGGAALHRAQCRPGHGRSLFLHRRRPKPLQQRAPGGGLPRAHSERVELWREAKQGAHYEGGQQPDAEIAGAGRGLHSAPAQPADRGSAEMGHRHRGPTREEDRHRGLGAENDRSALRDDARPDLLPPSCSARTVSSDRLISTHGPSIVIGKRG